MKHMMPKKILRFLRFDRGVQVKLCLIIVLMIMVSMQSGTLRKKERVLKRIVKANKHLAKQASKMKKESTTRNLKFLSPENQIAAIRNILEGTSFKSDIYQAIIDGEVYSQGNEIGDYTIAGITMQTITLKHKNRNEIKELKFPEKNE